MLTGALSAHSQQKTDNTIIVRGTTKESVIKSLDEMGYSVAYDGVASYTTIPKKLSNHGTIIIKTVLKNSDAYISGSFENKQITPKLFKFKESYAGHYLGGSFDTLKVFAESLNGKIEYAKL